MCWTTSFLWYKNLYQRMWSPRGEISRIRIRVGLRRRTDRSDRPQVAQLRVDHPVDLLGEVALTRRCAPFEHVVDGLRATDHDRTGRVGGRPVRRHALALEEVDLELEDPPHVVDGERGGDLVGEVLDDPRQRIVEVVERRRRLLGDARRLTSDEERGDADRDPDHEEPDDDRHEA